MNNFNKKYLVSTGIIIFLIIFSFFIIFSSFSQIKTISNNFVLKKKNLEYLTSRARDLEEIDDYKEIEKRLQEINDLFTDPKKPIEDIVFLKGIADEYNLSIEISFEQNLKEEEDMWPYLKFKIYLIGSFPDFISFLEELESRKWITSIENLNVKKATEKDRLKEDRELLENEIIAEFFLRTYFLIE